ncbi:MAG: APC family permease [Malacoplasma sp.]|nr:APC family permease [Malacoplasma sp.]
MSIQNAKKFGFFTALSMTLGSVVGIGIFLKNMSIIKSQQIDAPIDFENTFSFWSMIVSWIISSIISLCAALSFAEISTCRTSKSGLSGWIEQLGSPKIGKVVRVSHNNFYYAILVGLLPFLSVEGLYNAINLGINGENSQGFIHFGYVFLGGVIILGSLFAINFLSIKGVALIQNTSLILKIIPISLVAIIGICNVNNSMIIDSNISSSLTSSNNVIAIPSTNWFSINGMFMTLPAVLFSFDSFLNIGVLSTDVKNPKRNVPLVAIFTVAIAAIIYIMIAIGSGLTGLGSAGDILKTLLPADNVTGKSALDITINIFITISAIGVCNSMVASILRSSDALIENGQIMFAKTLHNLSQKRQSTGSLVLALCSSFFYTFVFGIAATILNNDAIIDSATNAPTLIFFVIYALTIGLAIKDRFTKQQCQKVRGFMLCAPIAIIGTIIVVAYVFFYQNLVLVIQQPFQTSSAGLFFTGNQYNWLAKDNAILFWTMFAWLIIFPVINNLVVKKTNLSKF